MKRVEADNLRTGLKQRGRQRRQKLAETAAVSSGRVRNDLCPKLELVYRDPRDLVIPSRNVRGADETQIQRVVRSVSVAGFVDPPLIDENNVVINGVTRKEVAQMMNLAMIPCIMASHLSDNEKRALRLALNRIGERGAWSLPELKAELLELIDADVEIEDTGFTVPEFDQITFDDEVETVEKGLLAPDPKAQPVARLGDVFLLGDLHRIVCGDATDAAIYGALVQGNKARLVATDEPYNVPIAGHVTKGGHREFAMASGEMTAEQYKAFNQAWMQAAIPHLREGGLLGTFIDWRGYPVVHAAALEALLTPINLIVWAKTNAGLGSLYRSQHEFFALFKKGTEPHVNNIQLGKNGRWRSNVWTYPGASSVRSDSRQGLEFHPTVKPVAMCADAILDLTDRGDIVLDPFFGSGSTLIAAQQTGRRCFGIELDPLYVDVAINRYREVYNRSAILEATGESFEQLAERRKAEVSAS